MHLQTSYDGRSVAFITLLFLFESVLYAVAVILEQWTHTLQLHANRNDDLRTPDPAQAQLNVLLKSGCARGQNIVLGRWSHVVAIEMH
jgi:hypothetical protein